MSATLTKFGFARTDITPRVGVELCGFGPYINRHSTEVRDRLWARAMAIEVHGRRAVIVACDLVAVGLQTTRRTRELITAGTALNADAVMICCSHTHSGPAPLGCYIGWGEPDPPYLEILPQYLAAAAEEALDRLQPAELHHAEVPCEGVAINREYDRDAQPLEDVLKDDWRPEKPELTETTCHVFCVRDDGDKLLGFASYFSCHPVVCCAQNKQIHGDFVGVATNKLEQEQVGAVGLFLQGALGDVNSCAVHKPAQESLHALDVVAERYAAAVRKGIDAARPVELDRLCMARRPVTFSRKPWSVEEIERRLAECEAVVAASIESDPASDASHDARINMVYATALRGLLARHERNEPLNRTSELHGIRLGPIALLGAPLEVFQAVKHDIVAKASAPIPLVVGFASDSLGYAVDQHVAKRGGYATDMVPLICGELPFARIHDETVSEMLALDRALME